VWGGNTLHSESAPHARDFRPFELGWGECVRFWGNQCRHYCVANDSGFTRVSLDLRCLDARRFNPVFVDLTGNFKGNRNKFQLGQYYASARMPEAEAEAEAEAGSQARPAVNGRCSGPAGGSAVVCAAEADDRVPDAEATFAGGLMAGDDY
jgi:hypothetical protein